MFKRIKPPEQPHSEFFGRKYVHKFRVDPLGTADALKQLYGDIVYLKFGLNDWYLFNHPDHVKRILVTGTKEFLRTDRLKKIFKSVDANRLIVSEGDLWIKQRKTMQPAFDHKFLHRYAENIVAETERCISDWTVGTRINLADIMTLLTFKVTAKVFFNVSMGEEAKAIADAVEIVSQFILEEFSDIVRLPDWLPIPSKRRKKAAIAIVDSLIHKSIEVHTQQKNENGVLISALLSGSDTKTEDKSINLKQARDEAITLFKFNAAHNTTSASLAWTWYLLLKHRTIYEELLAEIGSKQEASLPVLNFPPLLTCIVKESLRLYPVAWVVSRQCVTESEIDGYKITPGSLLNLFPWIIHRDKRFFEDPNKFKPERFNFQNEQNIYPFAYFPFGAGPRSCIGREFAMMEIQLVIMTICRHFILELESAEDIVPIPLISLEPKGGVKAKIKARRYKVDN